MKSPKICIALGTRPEIIKLAPIIKECKKRKLDYFVIHTGQHYSFEMDKLIFNDLDLSYPKYNLEVGSGSHGYQTANILLKTETILIKEKPDFVIVQGDTNSGLAVALAASKLHIKLIHVEAGLRSYDRNMPEELNRVVIDHLANVLYVPTIDGKKNAIKEGINSKNILITGNTVVDAVIQNSIISQNKSTILNKFGLTPKEYVLLTLHRPENVDIPDRFTEIVNSLLDITTSLNLHFVWPIHPRTLSQLKKLQLLAKVKKNPKILVIEPQGFLDFINLQINSSLIITDSGGIQEEACILKVPCITLRDSTERPESITVKANVLSSPVKLKSNIKKMMRISTKWTNPFGKGNSSQLILDDLLFRSK